jgi:peptide deformylase
LRKAFSGIAIESAGGTEVEPGLYADSPPPHIPAMAILGIARMGHPILRQRAEEVADLADPDVHRLISDMTETMPVVGAAGLAAPQVFVAKRLLLFSVGNGHSTGEADDVPQPLLALVNPGFEPLGEESQLGWEACLSVPGLRGVVPRLKRIRYWGTAPNGERIARLASGYHARIFQHEYDHLDGILYPQRMTDLSLLGFADVLDAAARNDVERQALAAADG